MSKATTGSQRVNPAGTWRLVDGPPPPLSERLGRLVGLRTLRLPGSRGVLVVAGTPERLHDLLHAYPEALTPTTRARIVVVYWRSPRAGWSGRIGPLDHLVRHRVALPRMGRGPATVRLRLRHPAPLRDIVRGAVDALGPTRPLPAPVSANLTGWGGLPAYLPAQLGASVVAGALPLSSDIRAHDVVLRHPTVAEPGGPAQDQPYAVAVPAGRHGVTAPGGGTVLLVDARRINPKGRRAGAYRPDAPGVRLELDPRGNARRARGGADRHPLGGPGLDAATLATLRQVGVVECPPLTDERPVETAALLVQLAMTGAVLRIPALPPRVAELIRPELRDLLTRPLPAGDPLALEARSVRQRRAALRGHAAGFALPQVTADALPELARPPSVSAILATRRAEMLAGAVRAIVDQTYPELELVLCLHGIDLPAEVAALLAESGRPYEIVRVPAGTGFGAALGEATRRARGSLVTKFDDDDSYGVEHVWDLVLARHYSGATLVGKGAEFVFLETLGTTVRRPSGAPESDGEVVAGGTMLLAKGDLEAVGGWRPVPRSVDYGVLDRLRRDGAAIYRTHPFGYVYHRRESGHTWDPGQQYFLDTAFARWPDIPAEAFANPEPTGTGTASDPRSSVPSSDAVHSGA
ncbi:glycosyltransferase [Micromonospora sp. NBC_01699]|uniref:glycosyltransferase n=1 Tax=Micromonospora sp. NBC_01699 TaxID=2975984 RepID=UPI002E3696CE|nr:glycosyltransferase [Micromonospora sp. NBC_01699]